MYCSTPHQGFEGIVWSDMIGSAPAAVIAKFGAGIYDMTFQDAAPSTKNIEKSKTNRNILREVTTL